MSIEKQKTAILYCTDSELWMPLYVSLLSILENNAHRKFSIYIICDSTNPVFSDYAERLRDRFRIDIQYIHIEPSKVEGFPLSGGLPGSVYYRMFAGSLLPNSCDRVLYLDCDTIIINNIDELFDLDLDSAIIGAVNDAIPEPGEKLGVTPYFNSGMLLINLRRWREEQIENKCLHFLATESDRISCPDQDVLNAVLCKQWKKIDAKFNFQTGHCRRHTLGRPDQNPSIVHFVGKHKPWLKRSKHPFKPDFRRILERTPYWPYREPDRWLPAALRKLNRLLDKSG